MVERYTLTSNADELSSRFNAELSPSYEPLYNIAPTSLVPVITNTTQEGFSFFYWGLMPDWSKNKSISGKLINAEAELLLDKSSYRRALKQRRCIIPADGFYLWKQVSKKSKIPSRVFFDDNKIFGIAAIWDEFEDEQGNDVHTFTIITTEANEIVSDLGPRMPAILSPENESLWLNNELPDEQWVGLLQPHSGEGMGSHTVSPKLNQITYNGADLINPAPPADQFGNYSLFDD